MSTRKDRMHMLDSFEKVVEGKGLRKHAIHYSSVAPHEVLDDSGQLKLSRADHYAESMSEGLIVTDIVKYLPASHDRHHETKDDEAWTAPLDEVFHALLPIVCSCYFVAFQSQHFGQHGTDTWIVVYYQHGETDRLELSIQRIGGTCAVRKYLAHSANSF
jgi:hypothetical protein